MLVMVMGLGSTVKATLLVPVPPGPVTTIVATPAVAAVGTTKVRVVELVTLSVVVMPFSVTLVAPVKLVPVTVTTVPGSALAGAKLVIVGAVGGVAVTVNGVLLLAVPAGVVTLMVPEGAAAGTVKVMLVALTVVNVVVSAPSITAVAPLRAVPVTVTVVPAMPLVGVKLVMVGAATGSSFLEQLASHRLPSATLAPV
jgi:hypothetical protein